VIVKGFKKCCISDAMDGKEDDILWEDEEEVETVGSENDDDRSGESEGGEVGNCEDSETNW
jgi:hypothetical protein